MKTSGFNCQQDYMEWRTKAKHLSPFLLEVNMTEIEINYYYERVKEDIDEYYRESKEYDT